MAEVDIATQKLSDLHGEQVDAETLRLRSRGPHYLMLEPGVVTGTSIGSFAGTGIGSLVFPAGFFVVGRTLRITAGGKIETPPSGSGFGALRVMLGGAVLGGSNVLAATIDLGLGATATWNTTGILVCREGGSDGAISGTGTFSAGAAHLSSILPVHPTTINLSGQLTLWPTWDWQSADGTFTCYNLIVEVLS